MSASTDVDPLEAYAPGGFAIVMATGIVAIAARLLGHDAIGWALFATTAALYLLAWIAMVVRTLREPCRVLAAFTDHASGPGFLTAVAATSVLGSACAVHGIAIALLPSLLLLATALWSAVFPLGMYTSATETFSRAAELPFLRPVPLTFFWAALLARVLAASGLARHVAGSPPGRRC